MDNIVENAIVEKVNVVEKAKKQPKLWHFKDGDFEIPSKVKCSKCGREVAGYNKLVYERVMKDFGGEWKRYIAEWKCGDCKREVTDGIKAELNKAKREEDIKKAIELLKAEGYKVEKKAEVVKAAKKA